MKWAILSLLLVSGALFVMAEIVEHAGRSADEKIAAVIPGIPAVLCLAAAVALTLAWALVRVFR